MLRGRFPEDEELERVDQRHEAAHEFAVTVSLHVGEMSGRVGVGLEQNEASVLLRVVPVVGQGARLLGRNLASLSSERPLASRRPRARRRMRAKIVMFPTSASGSLH